MRFVAFLCSMCGALLAQPNGDIVVTSTGGILGHLQRYEAQAGSFTTLATFSSSTTNLFPTSVEMDLDNAGYLVVCRGAVLRVDPQNQVAESNEANNTARIPAC